MPSEVDDLNLTPYSRNISVNWKKPASYSYCAMHYVIHWVHAQSGSKDSSIVSSDISFVIGDLDACVEYEVSVIAVNEKNESADAVTSKTTTETVGNYHTQIILLYL